MNNEQSDINRDQHTDRLSRPINNWVLVERYVAQYPHDWRLVFKRGEETLEIQVSEEDWRAFDGLKMARKI